MDLPLEAYRVVKGQSEWETIFLSFQKHNTFSVSVTNQWYFFGNNYSISFFFNFLTIC